MIKIRIILFLFFAFNISAKAQSAKKVLNISYKKCQSIQYGFVEYDKYWKPISSSDTTKKTFCWSFKKEKYDSIFLMFFHLIKKTNDKVNDVIYTGNELIWINKKDSTAEILSKTDTTESILEYKNQYEFYRPFINEKDFIIPDSVSINDSAYTISLIGKEILLNSNAYHIRVEKAPDKNIVNNVQATKLEWNFWIDSESYIPVQYTLEYNMLINTVPYAQYEKNVLNKFESDSSKVDSLISVHTIPKNFKIKQYIEESEIELLPINSKAPDFSFETLNGNQINLNDLKGEIVLIDFFYKSCYPCLLAMPEIQKLYEKYSDSGLVVIGIDPYDYKKIDELKSFLKKIKIEYPVIVTGKDLPKEYHISAFPTIYLINKKGRIINSYVGYYLGFEKELEEIIKKEL